MAALQSAADALSAAKAKADAAQQHLAAQTAGLEASLGRSKTSEAAASAAAASAAAGFEATERAAAEEQAAARLQARKDDELKAVADALSGAEAKLEAAQESAASAQADADKESARGGEARREHDKARETKLQAVKGALDLGALTQEQYDAAAKRLSDESAAEGAKVAAQARLACFLRVETHAS